jgi:hypothetical protein
MRGRGKAEARTWLADDAAFVVALGGELNGET